MTALSEAPERFMRPLPRDKLFERSAEILRFDPKKMWPIANQMVDFSLQIKKGDNLWLEYQPGGRQLAEMIGFLAANKGANVFPYSPDMEVESAILAGMSPDGGGGWCANS